MSEQESPSAADATNNDDRPGVLIQVKLRTWMAVASIPVGILFAVFAILWRDSFPDAADYRLTLCVGFGLVLSGLGTQASGRWRGWTIAGGGAAAVVLYLLLYYTAAPPPPPSDPSMIVRVEGGFHPETSVVQVEAHNNEHLFTAWSRVNETLRVRLERKNIQAGCIGFVVFVRSPGDQGEEASEVANGSVNVNVTYVPAAFFADAAGSEAVANGQDIAVLDYRHASNALFVGADSDEPISFDRCPSGIAAVSGSTRLAASPFLLDLLAPKAWAGEKEISIQSLIGGTRSPNAMVRREARQLLGAKGVEAVRPTMDALARRPDEYRVQLGAVSMLSGLLATKVDPGEVRALLTDEDMARIVPLVAHDDKAMRRTATAAMVRLADPRAIGQLIAILGGHPSPNGRYNAAYILNQSYDSYDAADQQSLPAALEPVYAAQGPRTKSLLDPIANPAVRAQPSTGWVLVGNNYGKGWDQKLFTWRHDEKRLPAKGDVITALGEVDLHSDRLRFDSKDGWIEAPVIGVVEPGDKLRVTSLKLVGYAFYWVEVEPAE